MMQDEETMKKETNRTISDGDIVNEPNHTTTRTCRVVDGELVCD